MKKKLSMIGILAMGALLVACGSKEAKEENKTADAGGNTYTIGINQLMEHKALDDARQGFVDGLEELGVSAEIVEKNAQGEIANATAIAQKFVSDKVDLMFAIATPSAQATARASKDIPILFTAVTDAEGAKLVETNDKPGGNITGTIDAAENNEVALTTMKHGEVAKYFSYDLHQIIPDFLIANVNFLDGLSDEEKKIFEDGFKIATEVELSKWDEKTNEAIEISKNKMGVEFIDSDVNSFKEKVILLHEKTLEENPEMVPFYKAIEKMNEKVSKEE